MNNRLKKAAEEYLTAIAIVSDCFGPNHPDLAIIRENLAVLYLHQGKYALALENAQRALAIRLEVYGAHDPMTAFSLDVLSYVYSIIGMKSDKIKLQKNINTLTDKISTLIHELNPLDEVTRSESEQTLSEYVRWVREDLLGLYFPRFPRDLNDKNYQHLSIYLAEQAIEHFETMFGPEDRNVAMTLNQLACVYVQTGHYKAAEPLYERALEILDKKFPSNHPDQAIVMDNLSIVYRTQKKYDKAEKLTRKSLEIFISLFGEIHRDVLINLENLANLYKVQGKNDEMLLVYLRILKIWFLKLSPVFLILTAIYVFQSLTRPIRIKKKSLGKELD